MDRYRSDLGPLWGPVVQQYSRALLLVNLMSETSSFKIRVHSPDLIMLSVSFQLLHDETDEPMI